MEGEFGEKGLLSAQGESKPMFTVNCVPYRNNPVFQGTLEGVPTNKEHVMESITFSALIWNFLNEQMIGVTGVNADPSTAWAISLITRSPARPGASSRMVPGLGTGATMLPSHAPLKRNSVRP
jgi:UbiD family decarboxylase